MEDPEFISQEALTPKGGGVNLFFRQISPENCMKMNKMDPCASPLLDLPMAGDSLVTVFYSGFSAAWKAKTFLEGC